MLTMVLDVFLGVAVNDREMTGSGMGRTVEGDNGDLLEPLFW